MKPSIEDAEAMQGFDRGWTDVEGLDRRRNGSRWKLVGNAVTVGVAQWVGSRLATQAKVSRNTCRSTPLAQDGRLLRGARMVGSGRRSTSKSSRRAARISTFPTSSTGKMPTCCPIGQPPDSGAGCNKATWVDTRGLETTSSPTLRNSRRASPTTEHSLR